LKIAIGLQQNGLAVAGDQRSHLFSQRSSGVWKKQTTASQKILALGSSSLHFLKINQEILNFKLIRIKPTMNEESKNEQLKQQATRNTSNGNKLALTTISTTEPGCETRSKRQRKRL
jgi:hypothetical protein